MHHDHFHAQRRRNIVLVGVALLAFALGLLAALATTDIAERRKRELALLDAIAVEVPSLIPATRNLADAVIDAHRQVVEQIAAVDVIGDGGQMYSGSGIVLRRGLVLSAAHIAEKVDDPSEAPTVVLCNGVSVPARVIAFSASRDVMFLEAPDCAGTTLRIRATPLTALDSFAAVGYEYWNAMRPRSPFYRRASRISDAVLDEEQITDASLRDRIALLREERLPPMIAFGAPFSRGNSGGAIVDRQGAIVGVFTVTEPEYGRGWASSAENILAVMKENAL